VNVLEGYVGGQPTRRHFCLECADVAYGLYIEGGTGRTRPRPHLSSLLIAAGLLLALVGASVDLLGIEGHAGFGWKQQAGLVVGTLLVALGALLRVDALAIGGALLFGVAALADVYGTVGTPGVGWRQRAAILAGLVVVLVGFYARERRLSRRLSGAD
jgi:hypothetical protein